ncbi:MAG: fibronectin type III domain-containing protein [Nitrospirae bacterium]|nr:fibronectin type III domain-containing protein [Nitrospirota bacterium]
MVDSLQGGRLLVERLGPDSSSPDDTRTHLAISVQLEPQEAIALAQIGVLSKKTQVGADIEWNSEHLSRQTVEVHAKTGLIEPQALPGAPPRRNTNGAECARDSPHECIFLRLTAQVPAESIRPGANEISVTLSVAASESVPSDLPLLSLSAALTFEYEDPAGAPQPPRLTGLQENSVDQVDSDLDGRSNLVETAILIALGKPAEAAQAILDPDVYPSAAEAEAALPILVAEFKTAFVSLLGEEIEAAGVDIAPEQIVGDLDQVVADLGMDITPPETSIDPPNGQILAGQPFALSLSCNEPSCEFRCAVSGPSGSGPAVKCTSPWTVRISASGSYSLSVAAVDLWGNRDPTPATAALTVLPAPTCGDGACSFGEDETACPLDCDRTPPDTALVSSEQSTVSSQTNRTLSFSSPDASSVFQCSLDASDFSSCSSPFTVSLLTDGSHTFSVRAVDPSGNVDPSPATHSWTLDTTPPVIAFQSMPADPSRVTSATFSFSADDSQAMLQCRLDTGFYEACTSPAAYTALVDGVHTFQAMATDAAGNVSTASRSWTIDSTPPQTTLTSTPNNPSPSSIATFSFSSSDATPLFECTLDASAFASCTSPKNYTSLTDTLHTFQVRALDAAGNADSTPALHTWQVDANAPTFAGLGSATAASASQISLTWPAATDAVSASSQLVYEICQATTAGACATFTTTYTSSAGATSYGVTSLTMGTRYFFRARSRDPLGNTDQNTEEKRDATRATGQIVYTIEGFGLPKSKTWSGVEFGSTADNLPSAPGAGMQFIVLRQSPTRNMKLLGILAANGEFMLQCYDADANGWNTGGGTNCNGQFPASCTTCVNSPANDDYRGFDIAFEAASGDALIVYENQVAADTLLRSHRWDDSTRTLSGPVTFSFFSAATTALWVRLVSKAAPSDSILLIATDVGDQGAQKVGAARWNGVTNTFETAAELTNTGCTSDPANAAGQNLEGFGFAWETQSGEGLGCSGAYAATPVMQCWTYPGTGSSWTPLAPNTPYTPTGCAEVLRMASDPRNTSNAIALAVRDSAGELFDGIWNGNAFETTPPPPARDTSITRPSATIPSSTIDVAWGRDNGQALFAYVDAGSTTVKFATYTCCGGEASWSTTDLAANAADVGGDNWQNNVTAIKLASSLNDNLMILCGVSAPGGGTDDDMRCKLWTGTGWSQPSNFEIHADTVASSNYETFHFSLDRY